MNTCCVIILSVIHIYISFSQPRMEETLPVTSSSRVLHLRNLPSDVNERDVIMLVTPYGAVCYNTILHYI